MQNLSERRQGHPLATAKLTKMKSFPSTAKRMVGECVRPNAKPAQDATSAVLDAFGAPPLPYSKLPYSNLTAGAAGKANPRLLRVSARWRRSRHRLDPIRVTPLRHHHPRQGRDRQQAADRRQQHAAHARRAPTPWGSYSGQPGAVEEDWSAFLIQSSCSWFIMH
jgi:hypothetical protein